MHALVAGQECRRGRRRRRRRSPASRKSMSPTRRAWSTARRGRRARRREADGKPRRLLAPATTTGKNIAPRVAALLDVMQVSDILSVEGTDTFTRPIYAGNAIATVKSKDAKKVITVRSTAFDKAAARRRSAAGRNGRCRRAIPAQSELRRPRSLARANGPTYQRQGHRLRGPRVRLVGPIPRVARPARRQARRCGGRQPRRGRRWLCAQRLPGRPDRQDRRSAGLCRHRHFRRDPAPRGNEGSKTIIAINKDEEAPIFQVADIGLVGDLFKIVPELTEKL